MGWRLPGCRRLTSACAGPVLFQEGDYFGQTVNLYARIAHYARSGEVLVSQAVADASLEEGIGFDDIGLVELKAYPERRICCGPTSLDCRLRLPLPFQL
jgi:hypothetical protein